jgi:hypothetical protein
MIGKILDWFGDYKISPGLVLAIVGAIAFAFLLPAYLEDASSRTLGLLLSYAPLWLTVIFFLIFKAKWLEYVQTKEFYKTDYVVLEIKLPEEITQSPLAMETALNAFYFTGEPATPYERYIQGKIRTQSSLEIVSLEGDVRFFIRIRRRARAIIESELYSQYPTIEINETPDYMARVPYEEKAWDLFGVYYVLQKPDPYPIKTYVDFGLDREQEEEYKIDPLSGVIEFLGSLGRGEYAMLQIIIRSHQAEKRKPGTLFQKEDWQEEAKREAEAILKDAGLGGESQDTAASARFRATGKEDLALALQRNIAKKPFDTGIRVIYTAPKEYYDSAKRSGFPTMMRAFETHNTNGLKPKFPTMFAYPWEDPFGIRIKANKKELYEGYRWRSYLAPPYEHDHFVLSSEELATLYHFPGRVTQTPTLGRVTSRKEGAPPNIPR